MNWSTLNRITCKSCGNGLTKEEEENDQCNHCIKVEEREKEATIAELERDAKEGNL